MEESDDKAHARELANLRLEISALASRMSAATLPDAIKGVRRTVKWSALGIAIALLANGVLHVWGSTKLEHLEQRVERLEQLTGKP